MKLDESLFEEIDEKGVLFNHRYNVIDVANLDNDIYTLYQDTDYPLYFIMQNDTPSADLDDYEIEEYSFNNMVFDDEDAAMEYFESIKEGTVEETESKEEYDNLYHMTDLQLKHNLAYTFSNLLTKEYALIDDYNAALEAFEDYKSQGAEIDDSLIDMINTLMDIENNNIGALQYTLSYVGGSEEQIKQGMNKAEADLNGSGVDETMAEDELTEIEDEVDNEIEAEVDDEEITESLNEADEEDTDDEVEGTEENTPDDVEAEDETSDIVTFDAVNITAGDEGKKPQSTDIEIDTIKYIVSLGKSLCSIETDDATYQIKQGIDKVQMQIEDVSDVVFVKTKVVDVTNEDEEDTPELLVSININNIDSIDMLDDGSSYIELKSGAKFEADIDYADLVDIMEDAGFKAENNEDKIEDAPEKVEDEETEVKEPEVEGAIEDAGEEAAEDLDNQEEEEDYEDEEEELEEAFSRRRMRSNKLNRRMW